MQKTSACLSIPAAYTQKLGIPQGYQHPVRRLGVILMGHRLFIIMLRLSIAALSRVYLRIEQIQARHELRELVNLHGGLVHKTHGLTVIAFQGVHLGQCQRTERHHIGPRAVLTVMTYPIRLLSVFKAGRVSHNIVYRGDIAQHRTETHHIAAVFQAGAGRLVMLQRGGIIHLGLQAVKSGGVVDHRIQKIVTVPAPGKRDYPVQIVSR